MITTRYARANVPTLPAYDATLPNLNQPVSAIDTHGFRFLQQDEIEALGELSEDAEDGYIFEVDLSYLHHLHLHLHLLLAPESLGIGRDMYSCCTSKETHSQFAG